MSASISPSMLRGIIAKMKQNEIPPRTIKTRKEARELTKNDPTGIDWSVGDKYYLVVEKDRTWATAP